MARMYLFIAAPVLLVLCFLTQPLHSLDEPAHFLRVVQLSTGSVLPVLGPDHKSSGSYEASGTREFARFYGLAYENYGRTDNKVTPSQLSALYAIRANQPRTEFVQHSNTTIYFPLAYAAPAATVYVARLVTDRPLIWFYVGRLTNALLGAALTYLVLRRATRGRFLFFAMALLPITLFQTAALSADSLLIPAVMALALIFSRVIEGESLSTTDFAVAAIAGAFVGLGKIAYLPIVAILPAVAVLVRRRIDRTVVGLTVVTLVIVVAWAAWSLEVHDMVFTARQDDIGRRTDVNAQLALVFKQPLVFVKALIATLSVHDLARYLISLSGGVIGWVDTWLPTPITGLNFAALASGLLLDRKVIKTPMLVRLGIYLVCVAIVIAVCFLLYLQWNAVGASTIEGVQGRYFLPLLPFLCVATPAIVLARDRMRLAAFGFVAWGCFSAAVTIIYVARRYWI